MERPLKQKRNVIPRWRSLERTPSDELAASDISHHPVNASAQQERLRFLYERWRSQPSLVNAAEVIDCAVLVKSPLLAIGPAKAILDSDAMPATKVVAKFVLDGPDIIDLESDRAEGTKTDIGKKIRTLKIRAANEPRNALIWLEKARLHTLVGDTANGKLAIRRAFGCAPESRYVLRALTRFMVHIGDGEEGLKILRRSKRLKNDPWLQAAEIALADTLDKHPVSIRAARNLLADNSLPPVSLSELAAALGTIEVREGNRRARKYLKQSLRDPTENALSQAFWVRDEFDLSVPIKHDMLAMKGAFEARVQAALETKKWSEAIVNCRRWLSDEQFSIRAATCGSYIASSLLWSSEVTLEFCEQGLIANPDEQMLLNNKVVALCRLGRLGEAKTALQRLTSLSGRNQDSHLLATTGLYHFSSGNFSEGRQCYFRAVEKARSNRLGDVEFRAIAHWLHEEVSSQGISASKALSSLELVEKIRGKRKLRPLSSEVWNELKKRIESRIVQDPSLMPENNQYQLIFDQINFSAAHDLPTI
ncbi:MAG: hypothetical protein J0H10_08960 [Alphaproteobacteria bacterium]|nr:hypothetical protein [Alphaproteobacteria bacterium]